MSLTLYFHPFASFCWKVLIGLYENDTPFVPRIVNLGEPAQRAELARLWPFAKFPVLRDDARIETIAESTIILEYLAQHYPGRVSLFPTDPDLAREARFRDRFYDQYVHAPMQKIVGDRIRPEGKRDPFGVDEARATLTIAYDLVEREMSGRTWALGDSFSIVDCAAAPALHYADRVFPIGDARKNVSAYLTRLLGRPSFARTRREAEPYEAFFPK